ncbi:hypothetical protein R5M74_09935 [Aeromonas hydrophila]|nr:hypothetical protein R5M74_09935 [Aeromonas hydrophila]
MTGSGLEHGFAVVDIGGDQLAPVVVNVLFDGAWSAPGGATEMVRCRWCR